MVDFTGEALFLWYKTIEIIDSTGIMNGIR